MRRHGWSGVKTRGGGRYKTRRRKFGTVIVTDTYDRKTKTRVRTKTAHNSYFGAGAPDKRVDVWKNGKRDGSSNSRYDERYW